MSHLQCPDGVQDFDSLTYSLKMIWTSASMNCVVEHHGEGKEERENGPVDPFSPGTLSSLQTPSPMNEF